MQFSIQRRSDGGLTTNANYTVSRCEGLVSQGQGPLNVATGYSQPISLLNPPSEAEQEGDLRESTRGAVILAEAHFQSRRERRTPDFSNTAARMLASGWSLAGIFRAQSGQPLTRHHRHRPGAVGDPGEQSARQPGGDNPYGDGTINNWLNPAAFAQPALGTYGDSKRNAYTARAGRNVDLSLVRQFGLPNSHRIEARIEAFNAFNWFIQATRARCLSARPSVASPRPRATRASCSSR